MSRTFFLQLGVLILAVGVLTGCGAGTQLPGDQKAPTAETTETPADTKTPTTTPSPALTSTPTLTLTPSLTPTVILPPEPRSVEFTAEDGQKLTGTYYPAGDPTAPVLVLMHWAQGDQDSWTAVAGWVQDRGLQPGGQGNKPWKRADWFPDFPEDLEIAVFTFNFRGCAGGCQGFPAAEWLLDARAAVKTASGLQGADPDRILTAGASIGADGAVDACSWWNQEGPGKCLGAFALSPGSFLTVPYDQAAQSILEGESEGLVYCLFARRDDAAWETCQSYPEAQNIDYGYVDKHGMELIAPELEHEPLIQMIEFLQTALDAESGINGS